jgi:hypothetical protein
MADDAIGAMILQSAAETVLALAAADADALTAGVVAAGVLGLDADAEATAELLEELELLQPTASRPAEAKATTVRDARWFMPPPWTPGCSRNECCM